MATETLRASVLRSCGATDAETEELLAYTKGAFDHTTLALGARCPLADEPFVAAWERYAADAARVGVLAALRRPLVQLRFPVAAGTSAREDYRAATRRGELPAADATGDGLELRRPDQLALTIHPTAAGRIPVLVVGDREDFVSLVQALTRRNEPEPVPPAMGACIIAGYNNWDRVAELRREWTASHPADASWSQRFAEIVPQKELYQDRFILLSTGYYSATPPEAVGLPAEEWTRQSLVIRREHECAHYFTRRVFGSMRNSLQDELIADYAGIVAARGRYSAALFLRFLGLERYPEYRAGGRLESYRGTPRLSDGAFAVLRALVVRAAERVERFDETRAAEGWGVEQSARAITALSSVSLEEIAADGGDELLRATWTALGRGAALPSMARIEETAAARSAGV